MFYFFILFGEKDQEIDVSITIFMIAQYNCGKWTMPNFETLDFFNKTLMKDLPVH